MTSLLLQLVEDLQFAIGELNDLLAEHDELEAKITRFRMKHSGIAGPETMAQFMIMFHRLTTLKEQIVAAEKAQDLAVFALTQQIPPDLIAACASGYAIGLQSEE